LSALRKQVSLHVFTLRFEDSVCREARTAAEELAETTSRLSVEISDSGESGDLLRKYRVDAAPALVATAKDAPELRIYGSPTAYALPALLDALVLVGSPADPKSALSAAVRNVFTGGARPVLRLDLIASRRDPACAESAFALWRTVVADHAAGGPFRLVASLRLIEDFPFLAAAAPPGCISGGAPFLLRDGDPLLSWPFTDADIVSRLP